MRVKNDVQQEAEIKKLRSNVLNIINETEKDSQTNMVLKTDSSKENLINQNAYGNYYAKRIKSKPTPSVKNFLTDSESVGRISIQPLYQEEGTLY